MTITLIAWALALQAKLTASFATFMLPWLLPMEGPDIDYNDNAVTPGIRRMRDGLFSNALYIGAGIAFLVFVWGIVQKATNTRGGGAKIGWGLAGSIVCLAPTEAGQWVFDIFRDALGI